MESRAKAGGAVPGRLQGRKWFSSFPSRSHIPICAILSTRLRHRGVNASRSEVNLAAHPVFDSGQ